LPIDSEPRDERLVDYLLGRLSDLEAEPYDERSIADEDFVWRLRAVENDLVDAYVRGTLAGETRERFETFYMASPRRRERVMLARGLAGSVDLAEPSGAPVLVMPAARPAVARALPARWMTAAAAIAVVAVGAMLGLQPWLRTRAAIAPAQTTARDHRSPTLNASSVPAADAPAPPAPASAAPPATSPLTTTAPFDLSPETRAVALVATLTVAAGVDLAAFNLLLESNDFRRYQATLKEPATDRVVWRSGWLAATTKDKSAFVTIAIPTARLANPQHYSLELSGEPASGGGADLVASYVFEIVPR
jgi:hypothetical protein